MLQEDRATARPSAPLDMVLALPVAYEGVSMMEEIVAYVEKTDFLDEQMPRIEMIMASALAKQLGNTTVDMKIDRADCACCPICPNPHYHLVGTVR